MKSKIRVLDDHTINQIAAGEVIENPASVIKELVENSCDSGATKITVEIKAGGRQLIRVSDNGCGMSPDDAILCLDRHATSKIRALHDLEAIATMGFRGEALPSIASISKMTILTAALPDDSLREPIATLVVVEGGKIIKQCSAARSPGTSIEVKSLFFNVPVRRKFQRSPNADASEIHKMIIMLSLAHPHIRFELVHQEKTVLMTSDGRYGFEALEQRIKEVIGEEFIKSAIAVEHRWDQFAVEGYVGSPSLSRHNRGGQYLIINGRPVSCPQIAAIITEAFGTRIDIGRFPQFALRLTIPGEFIDVNVHPQKKTVRIRQESVLRDGLLFSIESALQKFGAARSSAVYPSAPPPLKSESFSNRFKEFIPKAYETSSSKVFSLAPPAPSKPHLQHETPLFDFNLQEKSPKVIGSVGRYLILDPSSKEYFGIAEEAIVFIDQHLAHLAVLYEVLLDKYAHKDSKVSVEVQPLLLPLMLFFGVDEAHVISENIEILKAMGVFLSKEPDGCFALTALPHYIKFSEAESYVRDLIDMLQKDGAQAHSRMEMIRHAAKAAHLAAITHRKKLTLLESEALLKQLLKCRQFLYDPFGNSLLVSLTPEQISAIGK